MLEATLGIPDLAAVTTASQPGVLKPSVTIFRHDFSAAEVELAKAAPSNAQLLEFAEKHSPPEKWWEETDDPFAAQDDQS